MQLPPALDGPLSPLFSPPPDPGYPMSQPYLPSAPSTPLTQYMSRTGSGDENDGYTQETDMSATEDADVVRGFTPPRRPSPEELRRAQAWMRDLGLDVDGVRAVAEKVQQANEGLSAEKERLEAALESLGASVQDWEDALHTVRMGADDPKGSEAERRCLLRAEEGLQEAVALAQARHEGMREEVVAVDARIGVVQELVGHMHEAPPAPWCPICMTRPVDVVAQPCGHAFCRRCAGKMTQNRRRPCFICRTHCKGTLALHFS
ncbi:hypothetical protein WJX74_006488 [Apatococcus lobatus]|uniref:RING-type domain-containing protein n=1 Tax=Apatococcus lobatus TaxID=904363 RepID=A0AAW1Q5H9_9CHLO